MLKTILSIAGKPGLYKLVSQGKNMLIVESLIDKKRFPAYGNEKIISLGHVYRCGRCAFKGGADFHEAERKRSSRNNGLEKSQCRRLACLLG